MAVDTEIIPLPHFRNSLHSETRDRLSTRPRGPQRRVFVAGVGPSGSGDLADSSTGHDNSENAITGRLVLRRFQPGDEKPFKELNEAWISRDFTLEPGDHEVLDDPQGKILAKGGQICVADLEGVVVGCCALIPINPGEFELAKMTVSETARGRGIGRRLLVFAIAIARVLRAHRLYLESNTKAAEAIHLYEKLGFRHMTASELASKYARANVFMEMFLHY